jgi:hypothetical protein
MQAVERVPDAERPLIRQLHPELDAELTELENKNRETLAAVDGIAYCPGLLISHEGEWALARTPPGSTVRECSLGAKCEAPGGDHLVGNYSCTQLAIPCPTCQEGTRT